MHVIDEWANWLTLKVSPATHHAYRWEIDRLATYFPDRELKTLKLIDLTAYLAARRQSGAGDAAIYRAVNALRSFYGYHLGKRSPALKVPMKRPADRIQPALTPKQALDVLACCDTSKPIGRRDLALQAVMMDSGIRAAEVCRLDLADLQLDDRLFKVIVKGDRRRLDRFPMRRPATWPRGLATAWRLVQRGLSLWVSNRVVRSLRPTAYGRSSTPLGNGPACRTTTRTCCAAPSPPSPPSWARRRASSRRPDAGEIWRWCRDTQARSKPARSLPTALFLV